MMCNSDKKKRNNGFTLVEMIVTMMLLSILLTVSVMSLLAWQDWSDFRQSNEYAETMFLAAQNQLSEYNSNGTLDELGVRAYDGSNRVTLSEIYYGEDEAYLEDTVWTTVDKGTLVSVCCNKGDYKLYSSGNATTSPTAPIVYELLESYLYDTSILNDAICVEFSIEDGQVFSVLYSSKSDSSGIEQFVYDNSNDDITGIVNIATRYEEYRKERMVGYYGVDTLSMALRGEKEKPKISDVMLNNEETLNLSFKVSEPVSSVQELDYDIVIYDVDKEFCKAEGMADGVPVLKITVDGAVKNRTNRANVMCPVVRYVKNETTGEWDTQDLGEYPVLAWTDVDGTMRIVLDAADYQATSESYRENLNILMDTSNYSRIDSDSFYFKSTYSFHRFGIAAQQIMCSVTGYGEKYETTTARQSNTSYVYFGDVNSNTDDINNIANYNYQIANARHLYNMRYVTDLTANTAVSVDELKLSCSHYAQDMTIACHFQITDDIDWENFVAYENFFNTGENNILVPEDMEGDFVSMRQLRVDDTIEGNGHTISGLNITQAGNDLSALYSDGTSETSRKPVGLISVNYGNIKNIKLDKISVTTGDSYAGAFAGVNVCGVAADGSSSGELTGLYVLSTDKENASIVRGSAYVGGITGKVECAKTMTGEFNADFSELYNYAEVSGGSYVGGIAGEVKNLSDSRVYMTLDDCHNYGMVYAFQSKDDEITNCRFIGGIAGLCANMYAAGHMTETGVDALITISNSTGSPRYNSEMLSYYAGADENYSDYSDRACGTYVGGILGLGYYCTLYNVDGMGDDGGTGYVFGLSYVGGIVGYYISNVPLDGYAGNVRGVNENYVVGCSYVGGITGCNAGLSVSSDYGSDFISILEDSDTVPVLAPDSDMGKQVQSWTNYGMIYATEKYSGGICGYNSGILFDCTDRTGERTVTGNYTSSYAADYVGGITGYNNGTIGSSGTETIVPYVFGGSYVGGIAGYNAGGASVYGCTVSGGSVSGDTDRGCYAGGMVGCNSSILLFQNTDGTVRNLSSAVSSVSGKYFVGGSIGGNIINTNGYNLNSVTETGTAGSEDIATDSSAGQTSSLCYVVLNRGGIWGSADSPTAQYDYIVYNNSDTMITSWTLKFHVAKGTTHQSGPWNVSEDEVIETDNELIFTFHSTVTIWPGDTKGSAFQMTFTNYADLYSFDVTDIEFFYEGGDGNKTTTKPGSLAVTEKNKHEITGEADATYNIELVNTSSTHINQIRITNNSDQDIIDWYIELPADGIKGISGFSCDIEEITSEDGKKYYRFTKKNREKLSAGGGRFDLYEPIDVETSSTIDYLKQNVKLVFYTTKLQQKTEDKTYVRIQAGFDMDNFKGTVEATAFAGGFLGYTILVNSTDRGYSSALAENIRQVTTTADSSYAAVNAVKTMQKTTSGAQIYISGTVGSGSVTAGDYAGGILGYADADTFMYIDGSLNKSVVTAHDGCAGGITGSSLYVYNKLTDCQNTGSVYGRDIAGGIAGENGGTISTCVVNTDISGGLGVNAACYGGIAGVSGNADTNEEAEGKINIIECFFDGNVTGASDGMTANVGGIVGFNDKNSGIKACIIGNDSGSSGTTIAGGTTNLTVYDKTRANVGGIAGTNYGSIGACNNRAASTDSVSISAYMGYAGGASGFNAEGAVISGTADEPLTTGDTWTIHCVGSDEDNAAGGIAGYSCSGEDVEFVQNYGSVSIDGDRSAAGGIFGILENKSSTDMKLNRCFNYGDVSGTKYAGGLIGILRYKSVQFTSCSNDGNITGLGTGYVDTMIGYVDITDGSIKFTDCTVNGVPYVYQSQTAQLAESMNSVAAYASELSDDDMSASDTLTYSDTATISDADDNITDTATYTDAEYEYAVARKLSAPSVEDLKNYNMVGLVYDGETWLPENATDGDAVLDRVSARSYKISLVENTDYYKIMIKDAGCSFGTIYAKACDDGYEIYYSGTGVSGCNEKKSFSDDPYAVYCGLLTESDSVGIPYSDYAELMYDIDKIDVIIPDTTVLVTVQSAVGEDKSDTYESSDVSVWKIVTDDDGNEKEWTGEVSCIVDETDIPYVTSDETNDSSLTAWRVQADSDVLVQVLSVRSDAGVCSNEYYVLNTERDTFETDSESLGDDVCIIVRFAGIGDFGLEDWTDFYILTNTGMENISGTD